MWTEGGRIPLTPLRSAIFAIRLSPGGSFGKINGSEEAKGTREIREWGWVRGSSAEGHASLESYSFKEICSATSFPLFP